MKAIVNRKLFIAALRAVTTQIGSAQEGFSNAIMIQAGENGLVRLASWRRGVSISRKMRATIVDAGMACTDARQLMRVVKTFLGEDLTIWIEDEIQLAVSDGTAQFFLELIKADRAVASLVRDRTCTVPVPRLLDITNRVLFAASEDPSRPTINCVSFNGRVAAVNGFQISMVNETIDGLSGLIPKNNLEAARKVFRSDDLSAWIIEDRIALSDGQTTVEGEFYTHDKVNFPSIEPIIPKDWKLSITVSTAELRTALVSMMAIFPRRHYQKIVRFTIDENKITIAAINPPLEARVSIPAEIERTDDDFELPLETAFNAMYLLEHARRAGNRVRLLMNAKNSPVLIKPVEESTWQGVLMPAHMG